MNARKVTFPGSRGAELAGRVSAPDDAELRSWALFAHCFTCSKDLRAVGAISAALNHEGIGVLRFDFTGLGESEGDFADADFASNVEDLAAAAEFMEAELAAPSILIGHSLGGSAALSAVGKIPSVRAVATIGAPFDPGHVRHLFDEDLDTIEAEGSARVSIAGRTFTVTREFVRSLQSPHRDEEIASMETPLLVFHSPVDEIVGVENARLIYDAAKHPKSYVSLDDADHLLTRAEDSRYVGSVLAAWAERYALTPRPQREFEQVREEDRVVARTGSEGYRTRISTGNHRMIADEPVEVGGDDLGPTPYDLLAASLASCTSMTLQMYARRKGWPLDEVVTRIRHTRMHGEDCEEGEGAGKMDRLAREIELVGELDGDQRERLLEIANRCPVHRTFEGGIEVTTEAAGGE